MVIFLLCARFSREVRTSKCEGTDPGWGSLVGISVIVNTLLAVSKKTALTARQTLKFRRILKAECSKCSRSQDRKIQDMSIHFSSSGVNFSEKGWIEPVSSQEQLNVCGANKLGRREHACIEASRPQSLLA
jgi:hypothetical protein